MIYGKLYFCFRKLLKDNHFENGENGVYEVIYSLTFIDNLLIGPKNLHQVS